ncbi:MAG: sulfurtransferase TusA family protein [Gammaproteobacteria bacterium]|nr:sulfurtransferase TusA family protein [Gammaproteobacteria bacterium]MCW8840594.1 sulfurtransferase TusA family protein [Gammaproteobacteria bacterium]MCW8928399.1 sulfurtransferase TusA family protein [Gammaproteobacteria bacterium]MCW8957696.1 sulfurtransferase TusA family protein [Gammaproteobacteria bacterium]MCW8972435.1 sulfurtransferase TusA family protein [Gammaproteobacteria bacterium]
MSKDTGGHANPRVERELDLSGLNCPLPILKTKAELATMAPGEVLRIIVTNSDSVREIEHYAKQTGAELRQDSSAGDGSFIFYFKKG